MGTLNRAFNSLRLIKFAAIAQPGFYWQSFLDPEANDYDAIRNEIFNKDQMLNHVYDESGTKYYSIDGHRVNKDVVDQAFSDAMTANETAAAKRRADVLPHFVRGASIGAGIGGTGGTALGYWGAGKLGFGTKGKMLSALGVGTAGALLGGAVGGNIAGNIHVKQHGKYDNGPDPLVTLNDKIKENLKIYNDGLPPESADKFSDVNAIPNFINVNAVEDARKARSK